MVFKLPVVPPNTGRIEGFTVRLYCPLTLRCRIEFGLFDDDVGQTALFRLPADADVQIVLQGAERSIGKRDLLALLAGRSFCRILGGQTGRSRHEETARNGKQDQTPEASSGSRCHRPPFGRQRSSPIL